MDKRPAPGALYMEAGMCETDGQDEAEAETTGGGVMKGGSVGLCTWKSSLSCKLAKSSLWLG